MDKNEKEIFGLNRNVFFMGVVSFLNDCSNEMIHSAFPAFFSSVLHAGAASLGMVEGIADGISQVIKIFSGRYSDKFQRRKLPAVVGYSLSVVIRPLYMLMTTVPGVLFLRITDRLGKGIREAPRDALISLSVDKEKLGRSFGYHRAMDAAGGIIGPLMAYVVLKEFPGGFNILFGSAFIIGILAVLSFVFVKEVTTVVNLAKTKGTKSLPKGFFAALTVFFILSLGSLPVAVLLLKSKDEGLDLANIPLFYLIYSVCFSFLSFRAGSLADKFGDRRILVLGYIILIASYGMIMFDGVVTLIVGFILLGLSMALTDGIQRAFVSRLSDPEIRGTAIGYLNGAAGIGLTLSGVVGGILWQNFGPAFALITASFIVLIGILALISQIGRKTA